MSTRDDQGRWTAGGAPRIVLASASPRRRELLALLGVPFEVCPSRCEEILPTEHPDPAALAVHLATAKAEDVAGSAAGALVLGADTIVALGHQIYGKPEDAEDAARMLRELSGRTHQVVTGVCVLDTRAPETPAHSFAVSTDVTFRALGETEVQAYAATEEPRDKAGAYAIQGQAALFIEGIRGDYPNVVGLPMMPLALLLRRLGVPVLGVAAR